MNSPSEETEVMSFSTRDRLFSLRCRSKRGEHLSKEDVEFLEHCWKKWPKEYEAMQREVFEATKPFGSK